MVSKEIRIKCQTGIHLRPAGEISSKAIAYSCSINMKKNNKMYNMKSVLGLLGSCTACGEVVEIVCDGTNEEEALETMIDYLEHME